MNEVVTSENNGNEINLLTFEGDRFSFEDFLVRTDFLAEEGARAGYNFLFDRGFPVFWLENLEPEEDRREPADRTREEIFWPIRVVRRSRFPNGGIIPQRRMGHRDRNRRRDES